MDHIHGLHNLTPHDIETLDRTHPDIPLWRTSLPELTYNKDDDEIVAVVPSPRGHLRLRPMRIRSSQGIIILVKKLNRLPTKAHPNLLQIRGLYAVPDEPLALFSVTLPCIPIMEYLKTNPGFDRRAACADIARGLDYLHRREIVHGAVRPSNILVNPTGHTLLGEFSDEDIPSTSTLSHFASYLAPELFEPHTYVTLAIDNYRSGEYAGEYRLESDIFGLGCTVIEIFTGLPPPPFLIPSHIKTHKDLFHLLRPISPPHSHLEKALIPPQIRSSLTDILHPLPEHRPHSGNALQWLERPGMVRVRACAPVLARGRMRRAARAFWNSS